MDGISQNEKWKTVRFKKLNIGYPEFVLYPYLFKEVDLVKFLEIEQDILPLFIDSQFGINPRLESIYKIDDENIQIAVLNKSLLSGVVAGLKIYLLKKNYELQEIVYFKNVKK